MNPETLRLLLDDVAAGRVTIEGAYDRLKYLPGEDMGFAHLDHHRAIRQGQAEVVFCQGKTIDQLTAICRRFAERTGSFLGTRADEAQARALENLFPALEWNPTARTVYLRPTPTPPLTGAGTVLVVSAGTSDAPVAEEALVTAEAFGNAVDRMHDVGVAGLHRLMGAQDRLGEAAVVIVVAGMEGALPSVVGGLVAAPVIAVPTSVGYGASFGGIAALLGMLNSCAAGITVVNIDNGFGAAAAASRINHRP
ncbi:MAG: nickel pincer cofactor biosynthesis protein LarB [Gemmatimonadetes bacterium]|nr:MAG: nickel pincer cofactor biosynthesis protein LarB [Gemmatimonadota bacterium]